MLLYNKVALFCKETTVKYQWIVISFWVFLIIFMICPSSTSKYNLFMSYLNYDFGFIKRGLFGEILDFISPDHHQRILKIMTYGGCFGLILTVTYQFKDYLNNLDNFIAYLFIILSPLFVKNYFYNIAHTDILFFIPLLLCGFTRYTTASFVMALYPIMLLIHEGITILFLPAITYIYYKRFSNKKYNKIIVSMSIFLLLILFMFVFKYGNPDIPLDDLIYYMANKKEITDIISAPNFILEEVSLYVPFHYLYYSQYEHLVYAWSMKFFLILLTTLHISIIFYMIHIPVLKSALETTKIASNKTYINFFLFSGLFILCIIAIDRVRFLCMAFGILVICAITLDKHLFWNKLCQRLNDMSVFLRMICFITIVIIPFTGIGSPRLNLPQFLKYNSEIRGVDGDILPLNPVPIIK